jgi:4'-phosphopantetheinyl transferase EntD
MSSIGELNASLNNFVYHENRIELYELKHLLIYRLKFHFENYSDCLYSQFNSLIPEVIANSATKRKAEYLAGRICANESLKHIGIKSELVGINEDRLPQCPSLVKGCISHNYNSAIAAVSASALVSAIGVDIETILPSTRIERIRHRVIDEKEKIFLANSTTRNANEVFTLLFSIKESFFKATYPLVGYYFDFDAVSVELIDYELSVFKVIVNKDLSEKIKTNTIFFGQFQFIEDAVLTCLSFGEDLTTLIE